MHQKKQIQTLYQKFLENSITQEEFDILLDLVKNMRDKDERSRLTYEIWKTERERRGNLETFRPKRKDETFRRLTDDASHDKKKQVFTSNKKSHASRNLALFSLIILTTLLIYYFQYPSWRKEEKVELLEKTTLPGQKSTVLLPDGSKIHLNAASKLTYPEKFTQDIRQVHLQGEAFFEVATKKLKPFSVISGKLVTRALGTSFNVRAYKEQHIEVTVASGEVMVSRTTGNSDDQHFLKANTLATYNSVYNKIKTKPVNVQAYIAWKEGVLKFDGTTFEEVARTLQKWYGVEFIIENKNIENCLLFGEFENASLDGVMKMISVAMSIEYKFTGQAVKVVGKGCDKAKE